MDSRPRSKLEAKDILPPPPPLPPRSRFESLPTELRLQIYCLLLNGKSEYCLLERCEIGYSYSNPKIYPAVLAVNRSISAEAYPVLYGENTFLFLGSTETGDNLNLRQQYLSRLAGLPKCQVASIIPERSRCLIKHIAVAPLELGRKEWSDWLLESAETIKSIEFDFWDFFIQNPHILKRAVTKSLLNASILAIENLITASTQTFRIGTREMATYNSHMFCFPLRKPVKLPRVQLAAIDLKYLDNAQEKRHKVHKALHFIIEIMRKWPPKMPPHQALVLVEKRVHLHRDIARFWSSDEVAVQAENHGWSPVDSNGQTVEIGSGCNSVTWKRSGTGHVWKYVSYGFMDCDALWPSQLS